MAISDNDIVRTLRTDPQSGLKMMMDKYEKPLYYHIRRLVVDYDDAKDAAQSSYSSAS
ncbi:MAG: hypothetical protein PHD11_07885 [Bacteroidales bacterium]|nr:hypothetical protein [Bacteroidales bacterium]MDD4671098.1 hypothetical protein [Bacteroidales bacterium]